MRHVTRDMPRDSEWSELEKIRNNCEVSEGNGRVEVEGVEHERGQVND